MESGRYGPVQEWGFEVALAEKGGPDLDPPGLERNPSQIPLPLSISTTHHVPQHTRHVVDGPSGL